MKPYESMEIAEVAIKEAAAKAEKLELDIVELELRMAEEKAAIKEAEEAALKAAELAKGYEIGITYEQRVVISSHHSFFHF